MASDCTRIQLEPILNQDMGRPISLARMMGIAVGTLTRIEPYEDGCILACNHVLLPQTIESELRPFMGKRIGILRQGEQYLVKEGVR